DVKKGLADPSDDETEERDMVEREETSREYDRREQERREEERNSQHRLAEEKTDSDEPVHRPEGQDKDFDEGNKRSQITCKVAHPGGFCAILGGKQMDHLIRGIGMNDE